MKTISVLIIIIINLLIISCVSKEKEVPINIIGDWKDVKSQIFRFHADGIYSIISDNEYSIVNNDTLNFGKELCTRLTGDTGIVGSWKTIFDDEDWLIYYLNLDSSYQFKWKNEDSGGGYYLIKEDTICIVEARGLFDCHMDSITFNGFNGVNATLAYSIVDSVLSIKHPNKTDVYIRIKN